MHFFGVLGGLMFSIGLMVFAWIGGAKLYYLAVDLPARNIVELSSFYIALTSMILGTQLFVGGFLGELITRNNPSRNLYKVSEKI